MNVSIIGTGAYGLALSKIFYENELNVTMWTAIRDEYDMLKKDGCNKKALPGYKINKNIHVTMDMQEAISEAKLIVIAVPVKFLRSTLDEIRKYYSKQHICIASKGIEQNSYLFPYNIVSRKLKTSKVCVISGGTFAIDMLSDVPLGLVAASRSKSTLRIVKKALANELFKVDTITDILGTEIWGSIKNIMAIGCGMMDGMGYPESSKSLFFTKCFKNITDFVYEFGGNKSTSLTYAGIGDLYLTCNSLKSRNYTFGKMVGSKMKKNDIDKYLAENTVEGYYTLKSFYELIHERNVRSKLIDILYLIIYKNEDLSSFNDYLKN